MTLRPASAISVALCAASLTVFGCGESGPPPKSPARPSDEAQVRAVAKTLLQAYVDEDYHRLCAQFAPGTFTEWLAAAKVGSCERLFSAMTHFEAPSPQQINAAEVRVHGDRAKIVFREQGVEPYLLRRINGHWLISNEAEVDGAPARSAAEPAADRA